MKRHKLWGKIAQKRILRSSNDNKKVVGCLLRFQGQQSDEESGLYYNRFRYYDADIGQFISRSHRHHGRPSIMDNPITWIDPFGLNVKTGKGRVHVKYTGYKSVDGKTLPYHGYASMPYDPKKPLPTADEVIANLYGIITSMTL